jgi:outer membrane protein OmpA-like peptidoglycan-associated protein
MQPNRLFLPVSNKHPNSARAGLLILAGFLLLAGVSLHASPPLEHPVIRPIDGSTLLDKKSVYQDFSRIRVNYKDDSGEQKMAEGEYRKLVYQIPGMSKEEIKGNFLRASQKIGGNDYGLNRAVRANFRIPNPGGAFTWVILDLRSNGVYELEIVDEKPLEVAVVFDANGFRTALVEAGRISVYGIQFATNSNQLLPGSGSTIDVIAEVLSADPALLVEVQGHTDATGTDRGNSTLSQQRADTVKRALILYGIEPSRLTTRGYGAAMPVATNETPEGRLLNRRVDFALPGHELTDSTAQAPAATSDTAPSQNNTNVTPVVAEPPNSVESTSAQNALSTPEESNEQDADYAADYAVGKATRAGDKATNSVDEKIDRAIDKAVENTLDKLFNN